MKQICVGITGLVLLTVMAACTAETSDLEQANVVVTTSAPDYQWVQLGAGGAIIVRAIYTQPGQPCPSIATVDQQGTTAAVAMHNRVGTGSMPPDFDITVCEATLAHDLQSATLGGKQLALPESSPQRMLVIGDTGCRMKDNTFQNCNDSPNVDTTEVEEWLFTETVSSALARQSDLVIHVGDYIYREAECPPEDQERCGGSSYGQNWATWAVDFFNPADSLLEAAPWVFARGNHESCEREWRGWYLFLDPYPLTNPDSAAWEACASGQYRSAPFQVPLDSLQLLVMDSADSAHRKDYQDAFEKRTGSDPAWFITHRPLWGVGATYDDQPPSGVVADAQQANVKFLVGGHLHLFEMIQFLNDQSPPQLVAGGGATELDDFVSTSRFNDVLTNHFHITGDPGQSEVVYKFTFVLVEVQSDAWHIKVIDQDGITEKRSFVIQKT
ncbi:MAG TPA: metallophosphoesterase [Rhodothermales bacterium]|nr:metallophosphoesterase [Rhodothermales bacterium]